MAGYCKPVNRARNTVAIKGRRDKGRISDGRLGSGC